MRVSLGVVSLAVASSLALAACGGEADAGAESAAPSASAVAPVEAPSADPTATTPLVSTTPEASGTPQASASATEEPNPAETPARTQTSSGQFYDGGSQADTAAATLESEGRADDAALIRRIADQPQAVWLGEWVADPTGTVASTTSAAAAADQVALFVVYAIPGRDCGLYSAGGVEADQYLGFVESVAAGIDPASETWVVLEPDALAQLGDCDGQGDRAGLLGDAALALDSGGARVFLDIGHSGWHSADEVLSRIAQVDTAAVYGWATNTSNYQTLADERAWADQIAGATGKGYLVDTSRNGNGSNGEWCNPRGRALGDAPAVLREWPLEATAWVKAPGESDGTCNGGPAAGQWWLDIALEMARNA